MESMEQQKPTIVVFFNDWAVRPEGANCGGGETATMALAEAFASHGYRTIACAYLPEGETTVRGVEYWDFGIEYNIEKLLPRIHAVGPYYAFAATLVHPFLLLKSDPHCERKILINHSPGVNPSGLESRTVMHMVDRFVCVSEAQRAVVLGRTNVPAERITVIRNGFNPDLFQYAGPEGRDWKRLLYAGRLEYSKGIHNLLAAFTNLQSTSQS
jgi:glycosyltransferase involved in cell wall biosynthesis